MQAALGVGDLHRDVSTSLEAPGRRREHRASERSRPGTGVDHGETAGLSQALPCIIEGPGDHLTEQWPHLG